MQTNKFFILGLPRSGTTAIARTLTACKDICVYSSEKVDGKITNESHFFEPFALNGATVTLDWESKLTNTIESTYHKKYNGIKTISGDHIQIHDLVHTHNYRPLVTIRKDIWKTIFSKIAAAYALQEKQISGDATGDVPYLQSSRNINANFDNFNQFVPRLEFFLASFIKTTYDFENRVRDTLNPIDIIYFEDFVKPNATYEKINEYFDQEIIFNLDYNDTFDVVDEYLADANWTSNQYAYLSDRIENHIEKFQLTKDSKVPQYLKDALLNHPFKDK